MKKVLVFLTGIMLMFSFAANAQTLTGFEYFKGKWNVSADSPIGDVKMIVGFDTVDGKPAAKISDAEGKILYEVVSTTITEKKALIKFIGSQGEVVMTLNVKEADTITGDIMDGMAWVTGERVK